MQPTCALPNEQPLRTSLDGGAVLAVLEDERFAAALEAGLPAHRERTYPPRETLAMFVAQVLSDDPSLRRAVDERIVRDIARGVTPPSSSTAAYSDARQRLPLALVERLGRLVGQRVCEQGERRWRWRGRRVFFVDGTTFSMPDTDENQDEFPQNANQLAGVGFPQGRLCALSCAATGAIVEGTISACEGKASGEQAQLRVLAAALEQGDVLVGDAIHENYWTFVALQRLGVDAVFEINGSRTRPPPGCKRLTLLRPRRPAWMDKAAYEASPKRIVVRPVRSRKKGFRDKVLISSFVAQRTASNADIVALYTRRWLIEGDFRSLKCALGADILRGMTPAMVIKELRVHLLAYNLIRLLMSEAGRRVGREPRTISFRHAMQLWSAFAALGIGLSETMLSTLLARLAQYKVGNRPGRREPRAIKRRSKSRALLNLPRHDAREIAFAYERR